MRLLNLKNNTKAMSYLTLFNMSYLALLRHFIG